MSQLNLAVQEAMRVLYLVREGNVIDCDDVENALAALSAVEEKVRLFDGVPSNYRYAWRYPTGTVAFSTPPDLRPGDRCALRGVDGRLWFNAIADAEHIAKLTFICERAI